MASRNMCVTPLPEACGPVGPNLTGVAGVDSRLHKNKYTWSGREQVEEALVLIAISSSKRHGQYMSL